LFCSITKKPTRSVASRIAKGAGLESKGKAMDEDQERHQRARRLITQAIRGYDQQKAACVQLLKTIHTKAADTIEEQKRLEQLINDVTDCIVDFFQASENSVLHLTGHFAMLGLLDSVSAFADRTFPEDESEG